MLSSRALPACAQTTVNPSPQKLPVPEIDAEWVRPRFTAGDTGWAFMENAGGSLPLVACVERITDYLNRCPVQVGAAYAPSAQATRRLEEARAGLAGLFATGGGPSPEPSRVAIGASTTSLFSRLARGLAPTLQPGDEIVVTDVDHEANIGPWLRLKERGVRIRTWHLNRDSLRLEPDELDPLLGDRTRLVCFTHASNILGSATAAAAITARARAAGARVCIDGVAYAPHRAVSLASVGADWYGFSLYKVFGPHCAVLACAGDSGESLANLNHAWMTAPSPATRLEPGAFPYELAWGAGAVPEYLEALGEHHAAAPFEVIAAHEQRLVAALLAGLGASGRVRIVGDPDPGPDRLPTVSFLVAGRTPQEIVAATDAARVGIRHGHFYAPRLLQALGIPPEPGVIRVSLAHYNTLAEVEHLLRVLEPLL